MNPCLPDWPIAGTRVRFSEERLDGIPEPSLAGEHIAVAEKCLWLNIPGMAQFRIRNGDLLDIYRCGNTSDRQLQQLLMATPYGAQIMQRGELPLHAAGLVSAQGTCVLLAAHSGTGKSTTAAAMTQRGWLLNNDDVCRLTSDDGIAVHPGFQVLKLWPHACPLLGLDPDSLPLSLGLKDKRLLQVAVDRAIRRPDAIVILERSEVSAPRPLVRRLTGLEALQSTFLHTFRAELLVPMKCLEEHFKVAATLVQQVPIYELRVSQSLAPSDVASAIEDTVAQNV